MKFITTLLMALPLGLFGQTIHPIQVGGSSLGPQLPYFAPDTLTIPVGDLVRWTNVSGTHNVNATTTLFPDNPEGFTSGATSNDDWSFQWEFTIPGTYRYHCDSEGHSATQFGVVYVQDGTSIEGKGTKHTMNLFPSPATDHVMVDAGDQRVVRAEITGVDGRLLASPVFTPGTMLRIPIAELIPGNYLLRLSDADGTPTTLRFTKK